MSTTFISPTGLKHYHDTYVTPLVENVGNSSNPVEKATSATYASTATKAGTATYATSANSATNAGTAAVASKLGTANKGSTKKPIYLNAGVPTECSFTVETSVPANAKFTDTTYEVVTTSTAGLMSAAMLSKLNGIEAGANKYTHPSATSRAAGLYKISVNNLGHVTAATTVAAADIIDLGIPAQDTTYGVATTETLGLVKSGGDITVDASGNVSVNNNSHTHTAANISDLSSTLSSYLTKASATATYLTKADATATYETKNDSAIKLQAAKDYADDAVAALVDSAPAELDTLNELAEALEDNKDIVDVLRASIGEKVGKTEWATNTTGGIVKLGTSATATISGKNYPVGLTSDKQMYVNVPWTDNNTTYANYKGASSSASGTAGLVPAATSSTYNKFLRGDGTWQTPTDTDTKVKQENLTSDSNRSLLLGSNNTTAATTTGTYKNVNLKYNPSKKILTVNGGTVVANAFNGLASTATIASKLGTATVGSSTNPVYLNAGVPTSCTYSLNKTVPADAKFTDTTYGVFTTSANGLAPKATSTAAYLRGDATWVVPDTVATNNSSKLITSGGVYTSQASLLELINVNTAAISNIVAATNEQIDAAFANA